MIRDEAAVRAELQRLKTELTAATNRKRVSKMFYTLHTARIESLLWTLAEPSMYDDERR